MQRALLVRAGPRRRPFTPRVHRIKCDSASSRCVTTLPGPAGMDSRVKACVPMRRTGWWTCCGLQPLEEFRNFKRCRHQACHLHVTTSRRARCRSLTRRTIAMAIVHAREMAPSGCAALASSSSWWVARFAARGRPEATSGRGTMRECRRRASTHATRRARHERTPKGCE